MRTLDEEVYTGAEESDEACFVASCEDVGSRLDSFVSFYCSLTRSASVKLIESGNVTVNSAQSQKNYKLRKGDIIAVVFPEPESCEVLAEDIPLDVVYEDNDIIVVNKPQGMVVHPAAGNQSGTLVKQLSIDHLHRREYKNPIDTVRIDEGAVVDKLVIYDLTLENHTDEKCEEINNLGTVKNLLRYT